MEPTTRALLEESDVRAIAQCLREMGREDLARELDKAYAVPDR